MFGEKEFETEEWTVLFFHYSFRGSGFQDDTELNNRKGSRIHKIIFCSKLELHLKYVLVSFSNHLGLRKTEGTLELCIRH